jgi:hypothetical protein
MAEREARESCCSAELGGLSVYFRYTLSNGKRDTLSIGTYDETGRDGLTLARARDRAGELSKRLMGPTV